MYSTYSQQFSFMSLRQDKERLFAFPSLVLAKLVAVDVIQVVESLVLDWRAVRQQQKH